MAKRLKAAVAAAALALAGGLAGVLTAQALGQVGLPTVSVPTLSLPLPTTTQAPLPPPPPVPPAPPPPTVSVPIPPVPPPTPPAPVPPPVAPAPPAPGSGSSSSPSGPPSGPGGSSSPSSTGSAGGPGSVSPTSRREQRHAARSRSPRLTGIRARSVRVQGRKRAARITFTLSRPGRVVFVLRGPAPSCQVAGRFTVRGDRGVNHVRLRAKVGRRELGDGTYRVTARTRGGAPSKPVLVAVGVRRVTNGFACGAQAATDPFEQIFATYGGGPGSTVAESGTPAASGVAGRTKSRTNGGALPAVGKRLKTLPEVLPELALPAAGSPSSILGIGALLLLLLSGCGLVLWVVRYLRRPRAT